MNTRAFDFVTTIGNVTEINVYDNIFNQHLITIERKNFHPKYQKTLNNTMRFISDLEELGFRIKSLFKNFTENILSVNKYVEKVRSLYYEIGARFNHYFEADDMPMVASLIEEISETSRKDDFVYRYFNANSLTYIQNKVKQKNYFDSLPTQNTFEEAITNYVSNPV